MVAGPGSPGDFLPLIFIGSMGGWMYAVNAETMTDEWKYPTGIPIDCPASVLAAGIYFIKLGAESRHVSKKFVLVR
jgi:outer membrane protein assembly factor BamB